MVIRTEPRLRRVLVGNPSVVTTTTTAPNEVVVTAAAAGSSSVVLWQEDNRSRIIEVFADVDVSLLREAIARSFPGEAIQAEAEEGRLVLTGTASSTGVAEQIGKMGTPFSKEIVNSIQIAYHFPSTCHDPRDPNRLLWTLILFFSSLAIPWLYLFIGLQQLSSLDRRTGTEVRGAYLL